MNNRYCVWTVSSTTQWWFFIVLKFLKLVRMLRFDMLYKISVSSFGLLSSCPTDKYPYKLFALHFCENKLLWCLQFITAWSSLVSIKNSSDFCIDIYVGYILAYIVFGAAYSFTWKTTTLFVSADHSQPASTVKNFSHYSRRKEDETYRRVIPFEKSTNTSDTCEEILCKCGRSLKCRHTSAFPSSLSTYPR